MQPSRSNWTQARSFRDLILLPASVNGRAVEGLLDSGASITCVSSRLAEELGLGEGQAVGVAGAGGEAAAVLHQGVTLEVAGARIEALSVVALELDDVEEHLGRSVELILGQDLFQRFVIDIDYPNSRVALREPESFSYRGSAERLALQRTQEGLFAVQLSIEQHEPGAFMIDTGLLGNLEVHASFSKRNALLQGRVPLSTTFGGGVGGMQAADLGTLRWVSLGETPLIEVPTAFDREEQRTDLAGIVGSGVLCKFRVIFDAGRMQLLLEADQARRSAPFSKDRIGLQTLHDVGRLKVLHVCAGSPAALAGWKAGEHILAIDGVPIGLDYWERLGEWSMLPAGESVLLRDATGRDRSLVAADYH